MDVVLSKCAHCARPVALQVGSIVSEDLSPDIYQAWECPHCRRSNVGRYDGDLIGAIKTEKLARL